MESEKGGWREKRGMETNKNGKERENVVEIEKGLKK